MNDVQTRPHVQEIENLEEMASVPAPVQNTDAETEGVNPLPPPDPVFQPNQCRGARPRYPVERYIPGSAGMEQANQLLFGMAKS